MGDGRSVVLLDYDRDGFTDIASINTNAPKLVLFRNEIFNDNNFAAFRLIGANITERRSQKNSNRDAYGAHLTLKAGGLTITEELRAGEGFSAQNSRTLLLGLGQAKAIEFLAVTWPSGQVQKFSNLPVRQLITLHEGITEPNLSPYSR
jgi:hypothetical protein